MSDSDDSAQSRPLREMSGQNPDPNNLKPYLEALITIFRREAGHENIDGRNSDVDTLLTVIEKQEDKNPVFAGQQALNAILTLKNDTNHYQEMWEAFHRNVDTLESQAAALAKKGKPQRAEEKWNSAAVLLARSIDPRSFEQAQGLMANDYEPKIFTLFLTQEQQDSLMKGHKPLNAEQQANLERQAEELLKMQGNPAPDKQQIQKEARGLAENFTRWPEHQVPENIKRSNMNQYLDALDALAKTSPARAAHSVAGILRDERFRGDPLETELWNQFEEYAARAKDRPGATAMLQADITMIGNSLNAGDKDRQDRLGSIADSVGLSYHPAEKAETMSNSPDNAATNGLPPGQQRTSEAASPASYPVTDTGGQIGAPLPGPNAAPQIPDAPPH